MPYLNIQFLNFFSEAKSNIYIKIKNVDTQIFDRSIMKLRITIITRITITN